MQNIFPLFKSYDFQRVSDKYVRVWLTVGCLECKKLVSLNERQVECKNDEEPFSAGLELWIGEKPPKAIKLFTGGPTLCKECKSAWDNGLALEQTQQLLGETF